MAGFLSRIARIATPSGKLCQEVGLDDGRRTLETAIDERRPARLGRRDGVWLPAAFCRMEPNGVIVNVPGHGLRGGEEVRIWFEDQGGSRLYEATVLRTGVQVPDRGDTGLLLGFLSSVPAPVTAKPTGPIPVVEVRFATGAPLSLLSPPIDLMRLEVGYLEIQVPRQFTVVFANEGSLRLRVGVDAERATEAKGRVRLAATSDAHLMYRIDIEQIEDGEAWQRAVVAVREARGRG